MAEIAELEHRISAALARISAGVDRLGKAEDAPSAAQAEEIARLQALLDVERAARAEADAALAEQRSTEDSDVSVRAEVARLTRQLDEQSLDNQRLRSSLAQLREELRRLREAVESGVADAPLLNRALQAELESLRAARASETTEMAEILTQLGVIVEGEEALAHA